MGSGEVRSAKLIGVSLAPLGQARVGPQCRAGEELVTEGGGIGVAGPLVCAQRVAVQGLAAGLLAERGRLW
jgi:hypothetical protein